MEQAFEFIARTGDGAFAVDASQRIVLWNEAARRMLGFRSDEVIGRFCYEVVEGTDGRGCACCRKGCVAIEAVNRGKIVATRRLRLQTKGGHWISTSLTTIVLPSRWRELSVLAHLFRDVGRLKGIAPGPGPLLAGLGKIVPGEQSLPDVSMLSRLTPREAEVLRLLTTGATTERIAGCLGIGIETVRTHVQRMLAKLGVHSRLEAVTLFTRYLSACVVGWIV